MQYWIMKTEPTNYSISDLKRERQALWDGVRNYQARNFMRDQMQVGDTAFIYHSNTALPGIMGLASIEKTQVIDPTQFDTCSQYYDPKAQKQNPRWVCVRVVFKKQFAKSLSLAQIRQHPALKGMALLKKGQRLSVMPVEPQHARVLLSLLS